MTVIAKLKREVQFLQHMVGTLCILKVPSTMTIWSLKSNMKLKLMCFTPIGHYTSKVYLVVKCGVKANKLVMEPSQLQMLKHLVERGG